MCSMLLRSYSMVNAKAFDMIDVKAQQNKCIMLFYALTFRSLDSNVLLKSSQNISRRTVTSNNKNFF